MGGGGVLYMCNNTGVRADLTKEEGLLSSFNTTNHLPSRITSASNNRQG